MKKIIYFALSMFALASTTSCKEDKPNGPLGAMEITSGMYVINAGSSYAKLPGSITAVNFETGAYTPELQDAFLEANGIEPGELAGALIYGSKMYVAANESNMIWVLNKDNLKVLGRIQPKGEGQQPRYFAAKDGHVYASLFTGYVCRIDTTSLTIDKEVKVGPNPEQLATLGDNLYVANSDGYGTMTGSYISVINLKSMTETKIDTPEIVNATDVEVIGNNIFILCMGNYQTIPAMVYKLVDGVPVKVCNGTRIAVNAKENTLYVLDAPYGTAISDFTYKKYDATTLAEKGNMIVQEKGTDSEIQYPAEIFVSPFNGEIVVTSYYMSGQWASYSTPGYANVYGADGKFKKRYPVGVDPKFVCFK